MEPKERILEKADELFKRYGLRSVSMDDIAAQSGMSKKTVYQYYADKDELVTAVFSAVMEANKLHCIETCKVSENALHEVFLAFDRVQDVFANMHPALLFEMEKYHPQTFAVFKGFQNNFLYTMIKNNLERGIREELYRPEIDVEILTRYRLSSMMLAFNPAVFPPSRNALVNIETQLFEHFLYGLATPKGVKMIRKYKKQRTKNK